MLLGQRGLVAARSFPAQPCSSLLHPLICGGPRGRPVGQGAQAHSGKPASAPASTQHGDLWSTFPPAPLGVCAAAGASLRPCPSPQLKAHTWSPTGLALAMPPMEEGSWALQLGFSSCHLPWAAPRAQALLQEAGVCGPGFLAL